LEAQVEVDLARVGIAVERWRKARGSYPESLDELSVVNLALPHDVMTGNPLIYRRRGDTFTLYSAGLDRVDNGGIQADERRRTQEGDWVW